MSRADERPAFDERNVRQPALNVDVEHGAPHRDRGDLRRDEVGLLVERAGGEPEHAPGQAHLHLLGARLLRRARVDEFVERRFRSRPDHQIGRVEEHELRLRSGGRSDDLVAEDGVSGLERSRRAREFARDVVDDGGGRSDLLLGARRFSCAGQSTERDRRPKRLQKGNTQPDSGSSRVVIPDIGIFS